MSDWYCVKAGSRGQLLVTNLTNAADLTPEQLEDLIAYALDQAMCPLAVTERIAAEARHAAEDARERAPAFGTLRALRQPAVRQGSRGQGNSPTERPT